MRLMYYYTFLLSPMGIEGQGNTPDEVADPKPKGGHSTIVNDLIEAIRSREVPKEGGISPIEGADTTNVWSIVPRGPGGRPLSPDYSLD
jgi:hypothetical protein